VRPDVVAGHSLGEYGALVGAGVLSWTDALCLVRRRGELMETVNDRIPGVMTAVLGLDVTTVRRLCAETEAATGQVVEVANDNEPAQVVISGQADAVREAGERARGTGARRLVPLGVGAPFHCRLMRDIEAEFADALAGVQLHAPRIPVVSSVTAAPLATADEVRTTLRRQLSAPVRWTGTVEWITGRGGARFVEVGPGRVLAKLCRAIAPDVPALTTSDADEVSRAVRECASGQLAPSA
jgi:[acyl-carrier-protein] S-malonyltransferase